MAATYDPALPANLDWVRFLIGDTDVSGTSARLQDEEILALIAEEVAETGAGVWTKYFAAAAALEALVNRWSTAAKGVLAKQVSKLSIRYGTESSAAEALRSRAQDYRERGAALLIPKPAVFRVL